MKIPASARMVVNTTFFMVGTEDKVQQYWEETLVVYSDIDAPQRQEELDDSNPPNLIGRAI